MVIKQKITVDVVIIGGGIAGLWTLHRLHALGLYAILLENATLGGKQTMHSQGIIHSGTKYALTGTANQAANALAAMPELWQDCLSGKDNSAIDLSQVEILSTQQFLWSTNALSAKLSNFFASKIVRSSMQPVAANQYPELFKNKLFNGNIYALQEPVLNTHSLVTALVKPLQQYIYKIDFLTKVNNDLIITHDNNKLTITAQHYIFTAGTGNNQKIMQLRPLHMVAVKLNNNNPSKLFAHCIEAQASLNATPTVTITSHVNNAGEIIWYLGGKIAETGVAKTENEQIAFARQELQRCLPWVNLAGTWQSIRIDRAEPYQANGKKPYSFSIETRGDQTIAWPVKLVLAPILAETIATKLQLKPQAIQNIDLLKYLPRPDIATPFWEQI
ncbi:MAG: FAD-dependent oxidoreductase [Thiotrichales bacterium]|nr:MAG: FAD-dependent oxidoreductase [Thiotrichales bacterium]